MILLADLDDTELIDLTRKLRRRKSTQPLLLKRKWTIVKPDGRKIVIQGNFFRTWSKITYLPKGSSHYERSEMVNLLLDVARHQGWSVKCDKTFTQLYKEAREVWAASQTG